MEDRLFKKTVDGKGAVESVYNENPGVLGDIGRLANTSQKLPECSEQRFTTFYPFFPYHIHLIPEIVKSLRSSGGRGEQLSGSTRTLLAITQDIVRAGRRRYLDAAIGEMVSFDEVYGNLAGEAEVSPDVRRELSRIEEVVPNANALTRRVAEVLYIIRELAYIPRTIDNLARLLVEHTSDDLTTIIGRIKPELDKLISAKLVAKLGEEYEFLTGERRTFEEEVAGEAADIRWADLEKELADEFEVIDILGFQTVPFKDAEFRVRIFFDETQVTKEGDIDVRFYSPLAALGGKKVSDLENESLRPEEQQTIFVLCDRTPGFDEQLKYYRAMRLVIDRWKGDAQKSEEAHNLAAERELKDLQKVSGKVLDGMRDGLRRAKIVFRGSARTVSPKSGVTPGEAIRNELASFWPTLYPKFEKVPVRIMNEQRAIPDVLKGEKNLAADVKQLKMFDAAGALDPQCPLLDHIRVYLSTRQSKKERTMGHDLIDEFVKWPYGWDPSALRVGVAALVRSGAIRVLINKKPYTNPADPELQDALRVSRTFDKVELVLEETEVNPDVLTEVRSLLIRLTGKRRIDETPAALSAEMETFGKELLGQSANTVLWAEPAGLPLPKEFGEGCEVLEKIVALTNPVHRVTEIHGQKDKLEGYAAAIRATTAFVGKWGKTFTDMREFAARLTALEHRLPTNGDCSRFMGNWRTATANASVASDGIWKELQDSHGAADLELKKAVSEWREEARKRAQDALGRLPEDLAAAGLPAPELQETLAVPLNGFLASLDNETDPVRVAALPERASRLVRELADAIRAEVERRAKKDGGDKDKPPPKRVTRIRVADVATSVRIQNEAQWNLVRDRLDQTVKRELAGGNEVEIG